MRDTGIRHTWGRSRCGYSLLGRQRALRARKRTRSLFYKKSHHISRFPECVLLFFIIHVNLIFAEAILEYFVNLIGARGEFQAAPQKHNRLKLRELYVLRVALFRGGAFQIVPHFPKFSFHEFNSCARQN